MSEVLTPDIKTLIGQHHNELLTTIKSEITNINGKFETTVQDKVDKIQKQLDDYELKFLRPLTQIKEESEADVKKKEQKEAYHVFLRKGEDRLPVERVKMLTENNAETGGFFVIPEYDEAITKAVILISNIRQYARVRSTSSDAVKVPKRTGTFSATWVAEAQQLVEATGLKYGMDSIPNHELTAFQDVSLTDLEDSKYDLPGELNMEFAEQFAKAEGTAFVLGNGVGQPEGFLSNSNIAVDKTGSNTAINYATFVNCAHNLKSVYAANATWFLNRQTIGQVRLLVDGQSRPLWLPFATSGLSEKNSPTILGDPYTEIPDMPVIGTGNYSIAYGDWRRAYMIVDRLGTSIQRDPYSQNTKSAVRFVARRRVGGQLVLAEAIRKIQVST